MSTTTRLACSALFAALSPALATAQTTSQSQSTVPMVQPSASAPAPLVAPAATVRTGSKPGAANPYGAPSTPAGGPLKAAAAGDLYAAAHAVSPGAPGPADLYTLDKATGAATLIGPIGFSGVSALAVLNDGRLVGSATDGTSSFLIDIDRATGAGTLIGTTGGASGSSCERVGGLAYDPVTDTLWGMGERCSGSFSLDTLLVIDTTTGAGAEVAPGAHGSGFFLGTAWDPSTSTLYSNDGSLGLFTIDPATSAETLIGGPGSSNGMAIDGTGTAYGTTNANDLITIDLATGSETVVGNTGLTGLDGLVFDVDASTGAPETLVAGGSNGGGNPGTFQTLDTASFAGTIVSTPSATAFTGFTKGLDGTLWAAEQISGGFSGHNLLSLDETTGAVLSSIPMTGGGGRISDLATQPGTGTIYATGSGTFGDIYTLDTGTGALTFLGNSGVVTGGLAFDAGGTLYAISVQVATPLMATVDPATGLATSTFAFGPDAGMHSASFRPSDGALIASQGAFGGSAICEIDPTTGATTNFGTTGTGAVCIAYCAGDGGGGGETLYGAAHGGAGAGSSTTSTLYTIDKATGAAGAVGSIGFVGVTGLASLNDGRLVGSANDGANSILIDIDRTTGAATLIGIIGASGVGTDCVRVCGLTYDPGADQLYGMADQCGGSFGLDTVLKIDHTTGAGTPVVFGAHGGGFLNGATFDAASGLLYVADGSIGLVTIDPATSAEVLIGGPADDNALATDSSDVTYGTNKAGDLKTVDRATGNETLVGNSGVFWDAIAFDSTAGCPPVTATTTVRLGTPPNPNVFGGATQQPIIGTTWDPRVDHTTFMPAAILDFAAFSAFQANISLPFGTLLCALPHFGATLVGASTPFAFPIPNDCGLTGLSLCSAAGSLGGGGALGLTNALDIVIGTN